MSRHLCIYIRITVKLFSHHVHISFTCFAAHFTCSFIFTLFHIASNLISHLIHAQVAFTFLTLHFTCSFTFVLLSHLFRASCHVLIRICTVVMRLALHFTCLCTCSHGFAFRYIFDHAYITFRCMHVSCLLCIHTSVRLTFVSCFISHV